MQRFLSYFSPRMPQFVARMLDDCGYDPDQFVTAYVKLLNLRSYKKNSHKKYGKKVRFYTYAGYYIWLIYLFSGCIVFLFSPVGGIISILISPLIVAGGVYAISYSIWQLRHPPTLVPKSKKHKNK